MLTILYSSGPTSRSESLLGNFEGSEHEESRMDLPPSPGSSKGKPRRAFDGRSKVVDHRRPFLKMVMVTRVIAVTNDRADDYLALRW